MGNEQETFQIWWQLADDDPGCHIINKARDLTHWDDKQSSTLLSLSDVLSGDGSFNSLTAASQHTHTHKMPPSPAWHSVLGLCVHAQVLKGYDSSDWTTIGQWIPICAFPICSYCLSPSLSLCEQTLSSSCTAAVSVSVVICDTETLDTL